MPRDRVASHARRGAWHSNEQRVDSTLGRHWMRLALVVGALALSVLAGCGGATPSPELTPLPTRAQPQDAAQQALAEVLSELDYDLDQARSLLKFLADTPQVRSGSRSECSTFLRQILATKPQHSQLGATTPNGILFCDSVERDRTVSVADRLYFSRALSTHDFVVGEYIVGRVTQLPSLGLAYPILDENENLQGIVSAPLRLGWLAERFAEINIPVTSEIVVTDTYGNILIRDPDANDWMGKNISTTPLGSAMLNRIEGMGEFQGADGEMRVYAFGSPHVSNKQLFAAVGMKK